MENQLFRMKELKNSREKSIKKLTKVLNTLVNLEWEISTKSFLMTQSPLRPF